MAYVVSARHMHTAGSHMPKPVLFVIGATGNVGKAAVNSLSIKYGRKFDIRAGVRKPETASMFKNLTGVTVVRAEMGDSENLKTVLKGVKVLLINTPTAENRAQLVEVTAEAAKVAGVQHIVVISATIAEHEDTVFGEQMIGVERAVLNAGVPSTILRLPWFMENYFGFKGSVQNESEFHAPCDPNKIFKIVCTDDGGSAAAAITASPEKHAGKTYYIVSDRNSFAQVEDAFSRALSRRVKYIRDTYDETQENLSKMGFAEWQVKGFLELYKHIDEDQVDSEEDNDFKEITGRKPTQLFTWVTRFAEAFK